MLPYEHRSQIFKQCFYRNNAHCPKLQQTSVRSAVFRPWHRPTIVLPLVYCPVDNTLFEFSQPNNSLCGFVMSLLLLWKPAALPRDAMQARPMPSCGVHPSICPSVRLSRSYILSKRVIVSSIFFRRRVATPFWFSLPNVMAIFRRGAP